jgi:cobyrinic acid a,c-diamide synthase
VDAVYIGGGFPETHASLLAGNETFRRSLRQRIEDGLPVYAECGGLIYLSDSLSVGGQDWPMVGALPARFKVERRPQGHGYEVVRVDRSNPWFELGTELRGHEFRYCKLIEGRADDEDRSCRSALAVERGYGFDGHRDGLTYKNVWACFCHVHAVGARQWAAAMMRQAASYRLSVPACGTRSVSAGLRE